MKESAVMLSAVEAVAQNCSERETLAWDLWHYDHATFIPNWYALGCLITDVSLGIYVALQAPFFASSAGALAHAGSASDQAASRRILPSASSSAR